MSLGYIVVFDLKETQHKRREEKILLNNMEIRKFMMEKYTHILDGYQKEKVK